MIGPDVQMNDVLLLCLVVLGLVSMGSYIYLRLVTNSRPHSNNTPVASESLHRLVAINERHLRILVPLIIDLEKVRSDLRFDEQFKVAMGAKAGLVAIAEINKRLKENTAPMTVSEFEHHRDSCKRVVISMYEALKTIHGEHRATQLISDSRILEKLE
ncbi:hypothetical protein [Parvibaculum sp.]|uniref:hypothetical protein n=1 Tax=Parvibaculum sp. TaxID=2024848 RepID=UPI0038B3F11D